MIPVKVKNFIGFFSFGKKEITRKIENPDKAPAGIVIIFFIVYVCFPTYTFYHKVSRYTDFCAFGFNQQSAS